MSEWPKVKMARKPGGALDHVADQEAQSFWDFETDAEYMDYVPVSSLEAVTRERDAARNAIAEARYWLKGGDFETTLAALDLKNPANRSTESLNSKENDAAP